MKIVKLCPICGSDKIGATNIKVEPFVCYKCGKHFIRPILFASEEKEMKKIADNIAKTNKKLTELKSVLTKIDKGIKALSDLFKE